MSDPKPDKAYVVARYQAQNVPVTASFLATYEEISRVTLKLIAEATGIAIPGGEYANERQVLDSRVDWIIPDHYPVTEITRASFDGSKLLRISTDESEVVRGLADVSISQDGEVIAIGRWLTGRVVQGRSVFLDYKAGFEDDVLPADLLEVFLQLALLIGKEITRVGMKEEHKGELSTSFTRQLPDWARRTLSSYMRQQVYV